jgi:pilus assembly protein CpaE
MAHRADEITNEMTFEEHDLSEVPEDAQAADHHEEQVPTVLVLDRRGQLSTELARAAQTLDPAPEILRLGRPTQVLDVVDEMSPDVVVAAPEEMTHAGMRRLAQVHRAHPRAVILLSPNGRAVPLAEAAACGASDVLPYPTTPGRMRVKLRQAIERVEELRAERVVVHEPAPFSETSALSTTNLGHVLTITSASGGCGKTFYATNLAAYLAAASQGKVVLVDLDLQFGEVAVTLRIRPERTIAELTEEADGDVGDLLADYVVSHEAGYDVLCAPKDPVAAERVGPREATAVIEAARRSYDYVIVDTPPSLNEVVLAAFDQSKTLVVMATMDIPSLRNLRVFLQTLDRLKVDTEDVTLVLNKAQEGTGINLAEIERLYPQGFSSVLPLATEVTRSLNLGKPVVSCEPSAEVSQKLVEGATRIVPPSDGVSLPWTYPASKRRSWMHKFFRKGA